MKVLLCTIALNEEEFIRDNIVQHMRWPGRIGHIVVDGATKIYGEENPDAVTEFGCSVDATEAEVERAARYVADPTQAFTGASRTVHYVPHGFASGEPGQQKCGLRNAYCEIADMREPDLIVAIDADEFYTYEAQQRIMEAVKRVNGVGSYDAWLFPQRHLWWPPSLQDAAEREDFEVQGGYWDVPHTRVWRWERGARYAVNHNYLSYPGRDPKDHRLFRWRPWQDAPAQCVHYGFARSAKHRQRTNAYYRARGEGKEATTKNRQMHVDCRAAWESWQPGDELPHGARVIEYTGAVPEVMQ